jgi:RNA polymerase sigma-70 factor (ECF subfamily)
MPAPAVRPIASDGGSQVRRAISIGVGPRPAAAAGQSDSDLLAAIAAGSDGAFAALVERYQARFYGVARRMLGGDADAEDAVQIAFLHVHKSAAEYRDRWSGSTWLYRILTNVCIDLWRKRRRLAEVSLPEPLPSAPGGACERIDVDRALDKLPAEARAALVLCYVEELSYAEIARVRGVTVNTVKTQLLRAKRLMRKHLSEVKR